MANPLVSEELAALQLRIDPALLAAEQPLFTAVIQQASDTIADYLKAQADDSWDATTAPPIVQAATLRLIAHLWQNRGDADSDGNDEETWNAIARLLMRRRDPALA